MPLMKIHNTETNEIVEREMNADELRQYEIDQAEFEAQIEAQQQAIEARNALLSKLGITEDEAKLLLS